jgi:uncharacterized protein (TIGR00369 family)
MPASRITVDEFRHVLQAGMPSGTSRSFDVTTLEHGLAVLRLPTDDRDLRPGETIAGPLLFWLADLAMYAAVMSVAGVVPLAVTTDATIHFLRRPAAGAVVARARILKHGKRLVVGEVHLGREGDEEGPVAHAVMTYSVPPAPAMR